MNLNRRGFLGGLGASIVAAPAIVRAASIMPVRGIIMSVAPPRFDALGGFLVPQEYCAELMRLIGFMTVNEVRAIEGLPPIKNYA